MILKSIKLENFRRFRHAVIDFSTDRERNVTLIQANNTTGKTTIATAFIWCLYGRSDTEDEDDQLLCWAVQNAMKPHDSCEVAVTVTLEHRDVEYEFRRSRRCTRFQIRDTQFSVTISDPAHRLKRRKIKQDEDICRHRDKIIPEQLLDYIFIRAEQLNTMQESILNNRTQKDLSDAIRVLLGWEVVENLIKHLKKEPNKNTVRNIFETELESSVRDDGHLSGSLTDIRARLHARREELEAHAGDLRMLQERSAELKRRLSADRDGQELARDLEGLRARRQDQLTLRQEREQQLLRGFREYLTACAYRSAIPQALSLLSADTAAGQVPGLTGETITHLLRQGRCICGAELQAGSPCREQLRQLLEQLPQPGRPAAMAAFRGRAEGIMSALEDRRPHEECEQLYEQMIDAECEGDDLQDQIAELEARSGGLTDLTALKEEHGRLEERIGELVNSRIPSARYDIAQLEDQERDTERRLRDAADDSQHSRLLKLCLRYVDFITDNLSEQRQHREQELREQLQERMNEMFGRIFRKDYRIAIDSRYDLSVIDGAGRRVRTSGSENVFVVLAFIASVLQVARQDHAARQRHGQSELLFAADPYPLVLDAPLSAFDVSNTHEVCRILPGLTEQIIILSKDTESGIIREEMGARIGSLYTFEADFEAGRDLCTTTVRREDRHEPDE